jgi:hypothetical protein
MRKWKLLVAAGPLSAVMVLAGAFYDVGALSTVGSFALVLSAFSVPLGIWLSGRSRRALWAVAGFFMAPLIGALFFVFSRRRRPARPVRR